MGLVFFDNEIPVRKAHRSCLCLAEKRYSTVSLSWHRSLLYDAGPATHSVG